MSALIAISLLQVGQPLALEFHVSPKGSDTAAGTAQAPFATIERAKEAVHDAVARGLTGNLDVIIQHGTYELAEPLLFTPDDGGTERFRVRYVAAEGARVVLSGGSRIDGWRKGPGEVSTTRVDWPFQQLVVNGKRAIRARTPNAGATPEYMQLAGAELTDDRSSYTLLTGPGQLGEWERPEQIEVVVLGNWEVTRKRVETIDVAMDTITLAPPHAGGHDAIRPGPGRHYFLENAREFLDEPGEWYLNEATGELSYWPRPGEDMATAEVYAPRLTRLVDVRGTEGDPVRNLHFQGIRFAHADWVMPDFGFNGIQASFYCIPKAGDRGWEWVPWECIEPAIRFEFADSCSLTDGALEYLRAVGLRLLRGCSDCRVIGNEVHSIGASGIMVGENQNLADPLVPRRNRVENNSVHDCGLDDYGAVGIWTAFTDGSVIAHNLVYDLPYTGISVGFQWDESPTCCMNNLIEYNHIHHVLQRLCDGGCIYTLGLQPGTVLRGNWLHDALRAGSAQGAPNNGVFFDQGSKDFTISDNLIYATSAEPIRFNQCAADWHTFGANWFGDEAAKDPAADRIRGKAGLESPYKERLSPPAP